MMLLYYSFLAAISLLFTGILLGTGRYLFNIGEKKSAIIVYAAYIFCLFVYILMAASAITEWKTII